MAHAWRPDAAWHLSSRTLREIETEKHREALLGGGGRGETHVKSTLFFVFFIFLIPD